MFVRPDEARPDIDLSLSGFVVETSTVCGQTLVLQCVDYSTGELNRAKTECRAFRGPNIEEKSQVLWSTNGHMQFFRVRDRWVGVGLALGEDANRPEEQNLQKPCRLMIRDVETGAEVRSAVQLEDPWIESIAATSEGLIFLTNKGIQKFALDDPSHDAFLPLPLDEDSIRSQEAVGPTSVFVSIVENESSRLLLDTRGSMQLRPAESERPVHIDTHHGLATDEFLAIFPNCFLQSLNFHEERNHHELAVVHAETQEIVASVPNGHILATCGTRVVLRRIDVVAVADLRRPGEVVHVRQVDFVQDCRALFCGPDRLVLWMGRTAIAEVWDISGATPTKLDDVDRLVLTEWNTQCSQLSSFCDRLVLVTPQAVSLFG